MWPEVLDNFWVWLGLSILTFGLCAFLPIWIKDDFWRRVAMLLVLVPVSLVIILYVYPFGLEVFRRLAMDL